MKTLFSCCGAFHVFLAQILLISHVHTTEVDFVVTPEDTDPFPNVEPDEVPNFSFDDSTFYKLVWTNQMPEVASITRRPISASIGKSAKSPIKAPIKTQTAAPIEASTVTPTTAAVTKKDKEKNKPNSKDAQTEVKVYDKSDKEKDPKSDLFEEVLMVSPNNEKYRCFIPIVNRPKEKSAEEEEKGLSKNPYSVLMNLFNQKYCSFRVETFWTYEICHGHHIRQYHEDTRNKDNNQEYFLGKFNLADIEKYEKDYEVNGRSKKLPSVNVFDFTMPYISINMTDGTLCDLSQKKRVAKVLYVCVEDSSHDLYSIKETSTCEYEVITFSSLLCDVPEFRMKISQENEIKCFPVEGAPPFPTGFEAANKTSD